MGDEAEFEIAPEGDQDCSSQGDNADAADTTGAGGEAFLVPAGKLAVWLEVEPVPGDLNGHTCTALRAAQCRCGPDVAIAGFVEAKLARAIAALGGSWCEAGESSELLGVAELAPGEEFHGVEPGAVLSDPVETHELACHLNTGSGGCPQELSAIGFQFADLIPDYLQAAPLAAEAFLESRGNRGAIPQAEG